MTPYYSDDYVTLYNADNRDVLPELGRFDLLLTDPPYGLGQRLHDGGTWATNPIYDAMLEWDAEDVPAWRDIEPLVRQCGISIVWGGNYFAVPPSRCWLAWRKQNKMPTLADFELAWTSMDANAREFTEISNPDGKREHPTQKPMSLMRWCITLADKKKRVETILDPFAGSCTTGRAAKDLGRKCVLVEREERYCEIGAKRLMQEAIRFDAPEPKPTTTELF